MSNVSACSFGVAIDQILDQDGNIVAALAQCRHSNREHVETVEEILPEGAFSEGCAQVPICCREHSYVNRNRVAPSHSLELMVLEHSQQGHLCLWGELAHFIEEQGSAVGQFKASQTPLEGSGEGAS